MNAELLSNNLRQAMTDLPFIAADLPGIGGVMKAVPEHFQVEEILPYEACGEGEHLFVTVRRQGWNTADVAHALAKTFDLKIRDVGYGGRKDRQAVTTQTFSLQLPLAMAHDTIASGLKELPFEILAMKRHRNKIKTGHVAGNRFKILLTQVRPDALAAARAIGDTLVRRGVPNYFGQQRFGYEMRNIDRAAVMVARGQRAHSREDTFLVSALQGALFNIWLKERIQMKTFDSILTGDIAKKTDTGGMFEVEDTQEAAQRFENRNIIYTGPIYGHKMKSAGNRAGELENRTLEQFGLEVSVFKPLRASGSRRAAILLLDDLSIEAAAEGLEFNFSLPSGAYATTVLREFMRPSPSDAGENPDITDTT